MLNNFKNWIQNTAVAIVDDTASYTRTPSDHHTGTGSTMLGNTLKLNTNLAQSTSSLSNINNKSKNNMKSSHSNGNCHNDSQSLSEIDLSNLSREEKEHIEYVIKKAEEDFIKSENFLEMKRKSRANSQTGLNSKQLINGIFDTKNSLAPNNSNTKYSSSTSSLSSMSSCFSQNEHQTTSTPDEPNKTIRFNATDTTTNNRNLSNEHLENEKSQCQTNQFQLNKPYLLDEMSSFKSSNVESDNQPKTKAKRRLPSTPSFLSNNINTSSDLNSNKNNRVNSTAMTSLPDPNTLSDNKNVTEWLKKSFEQTKIQLVNQNTTPINNCNNKQYRRNSASNVRVIVDEPLIEINLSRHYYKKQDSICSNNLISDSYQQYSKSQTYLTTEKSQMYIIDPSDDIKTVLIYKDPKELSHFKSNNEEMLSNSREISARTERRPSLSLGLQIESKQISEVDKENEDKLGAIITSIEPDSVFDKFNVSINEGDEIVEICGVNLRNKSDSQIDEILDESCKKNNGEIEFLVRRNHSLRRKSKEIKNEPILPSSMHSHKSTDNNNDKNTNINNQISRPPPIKNKNIILNNGNKIVNNYDYDASRGFNEISIKKKGTRPREQLIADPALLLNIKNKQRNETQSRSFSPNINRPKIRLNPDQDYALNQEKEQVKNKTNHTNAFEMTKHNTPQMRSSNSPVALDDFRALRDTSKSKSKSNSYSKASSDFNQDYDLKSLDHIHNGKHHDHDDLNRKYSDGSGYSNTGLSNSSSKEENASVFSYNSSQKSGLQQINHIQVNSSRLDEKSSGYNSNQSTPTSEPNSLKNQANSTKLEVETLSKSKSKNSLLGEIFIQLSHDDERNELIVRVLKARNLISKDSNGFSDPYCKLYLLPGRETENKRRTKTVFKSLNPIWNETFIYTNIYREEVFNKTLEFTLYDWDRFSRDDFLGVLKLDLKDPNYLDNSPRWFALDDLPSNVNTTNESDNTRVKRDFKSRLSFKRSKSLRRSS